MIYYLCIVERQRFTLKRLRAKSRHESGTRRGAGAFHTKQKVFYSSLIGILLNMTDGRIREYPAIFFAPLSRPPAGTMGLHATLTRHTTRTLKFHNTRKSRGRTDKFCHGFFIYRSFWRPTVMVTAVRPSRLLQQESRLLPQESRLLQQEKPLTSAGSRAPAA